MYALIEGLIEEKKSTKYHVLKPLCIVMYKFVLTKHPNQLESQVRSPVYQTLFSDLPYQVPSRLMKKDDILVITFMYYGTNIFKMLENFDPKIYFNRIAKQILFRT